MKKHVRYKKAVPKGTIQIRYIEPSTGKCYVIERMSKGKFLQLHKYLATIYGEEFDPKQDLIEQALTDIPKWLPEVFEEVHDVDITKTD